MTDGLPEIIKHAAVKSKDGWIFIGKCHADCFHKAYNIGVKMSQKIEDQGFITNTGRYVGRKEAWELASKANQIENTQPGSFRALFSEDLWCPTYYGKHFYCEIRGYLPL